MLIKNWYSWSSKELFDLWHSTVIEGLKLPKIGFNAATNKEDSKAQWTTSYTSVIEITSNDFRAPVETIIAETYHEGLGTLCEEPPIPDWLLARG